MSGTTIVLVDRVRGAALLSLVLVAACSSPAKTAPPAGPTLVPPTPTAAAPSLDIEQPGLTASAGQTDSDWGPIWNEVPPDFPVPAGAEPAEPDNGPVSAASTIPTSALANPLAVTQFYVDAFSAAGYGGGRDGPLEDGSYTAWASNGYGCDILVTVVPRGDEELLATVLYGAGCPFSWPEA